METIKGLIRYMPDMKYTANVRALTTFLLYDKDNTSPDKRVIVWEELAEECAEMLQVDSNIFAKGYWKPRRWQNKDGRTGTVNEFTAQRIWLVVDNQYQEIK